MSIDILKIIDDYNLSVRRIPNEVVGIHEMRHFKEGDSVVRSYNGKHYGRDMVKRVTIPDHPGWYMVKPVNNTGSTVTWNTETDNLAPTLSESIKLFLEKTLSK